LIPAGAGNKRFIETSAVPNLLALRLGRKDDPPKDGLSAAAQARIHIPLIQGKNKTFPATTIFPAG
jgi:hypothetical protein